ncbi:MAG: hypothetical protein JWP82_1035 [Humibacillus sp.]|nr:hypothetical protein [Humibacillus sp.]
MMLVDCTTCPVRDVHCGDCMVTALDAIDAAGAVPTSSTRLSLTPSTPAPPEGSVLPLDRVERRVVSLLLGAGLVSVTEANAARAVSTAHGVTSQRAERSQRSEPSRGRAAG